MRKSALILASLTFIAAIPAARADGILEFFFPMLKKPKPNVSQTLEAPFADHDRIKDSDKTLGLPEDATALDLPHRTPAQIAAWITTPASEALTFTDPDYRQDLAKIQKYFTPEGWSQYTNFLAQTNLQRVITSGQYSMRAFVEETPLLINKDALNGSYKWLYEITLMVSYLDKNVTSYKDAAEPVNQKIVLNVQVGRTNEKNIDNGVLIEHWNGKVVSSSKNEL